MAPGPDNHEERWLRDAVLGGDEMAWRALYERLFDALYAYVYHRTGRSREQAEDVVQECWLVAARRIREFDPVRGTFEEWLRGIAANLIKNQRRRRFRWKRLETFFRDGRGETAEASRPDVGERLAEREEISLALSRLPAAYRQLLRAKYVDQQSVEEIAGGIGRTPKAVESMLTRAREAFRDAYRHLERENHR